LSELDFPNGTIVPTPDGNSSCSASTMWLPLDQLKAFPSPRFLAKPAVGPTIGTLQVSAIATYFAVLWNFSHWCAMLSKPWVIIISEKFQLDGPRIHQWRTVR
jgi:hypothetical protein